LDGLLAEKAAQAAGAASPRPGPEEYRQLVTRFDESRIREVFQALDEVERLVLEPEPAAPQKRRNADAVLLHPVLGLGTFLLLMTGIFTAIFWLAVPFMDGIDAAFGWMVGAAKEILPASWIADFLADGLIGGMGAVAVFLPQIVILFLAMGYLEDSGYLARGAALVDKPLAKIGLNGKSFVPLPGNTDGFGLFHRLLNRHDILPYWISR
jgi:ferrous iron transport protein B